jgi:molecular chaperone DnaJ
MTNIQAIKRSKTQEAIQGTTIIHHSAKNVLSGIGNRTAEWHYLMGVVALNTGFYNDAFSFLSTAVRMDPNNFEYKSALSNLNNSSNNYQRRGVQYNQAGNADCCNICVKLWCADSLCECFGGDLISCC